MACGDWEHCSSMIGSPHLKRYFLVALGILALNACGSPYYTVDSIQAHVVDAETGKPIEGAIVTANWQLIGASFDTGGRKVGQLEVMETVTDKGGRFYFPGFRKLNPSGAELREEDPQILIFKPGYSYIRIANEYPLGKEGEQGGHRKSSISDKTLKMKKADPAPKKYAWELNMLGMTLSAVSAADKTASIKRMISALGCERLRLIAIDPSIGSISVPGSTGSEKCE